MRNRPIVLTPVEARKPWGRELWLNSTRPEARALTREPGAPTLAQRIADAPELLGEWSRLFFGDELPIFTKLIQADFPPLVHVGFNQHMDRDVLLGWLVREQELLRALLLELRLPSREAFADFAARYSAWATAQAAAHWQRDEALAPLDAELLRALRENRARIVAVLNEVDLRAEQGNLLLTSAGVVHAILGLSHQTHPLDGTRATLQALAGELQQLVRDGQGDDVLRARVLAADLPSLRAANEAPPKNEGWLPIMLGGRLTLVEPQQSSDTTWSIADFYTPFVWSDGVRFRKGDARHGLDARALTATLTHVDFNATRLDDIRCAPQEIGDAQDGAQLFRLVDDARAWPFFTAHRLDLDGDARRAATWHGDHAPGVFQQLVVVAGQVTLAHEGDEAMLDVEAPAFIPATLRGGYTLTSTEPASLYVFSVPSPRAILK